MRQNQCCRATRPLSHLLGEAARLDQYRTAVQYWRERRADDTLWIPQPG